MRREVSIHRGMRPTSLTHDVVDWDVDQLDKVSNEAHHDETQTDGSADLDVLCGTNSSQYESGRNACKARAANLSGQAWCIVA